MRSRPAIPCCAARYATTQRAAGARWPQAQAGASGTRSKSSFVLPSVGRVGIYSTTYAADLSVSYQVDLFGRLARSQQAAWAELLASEAAGEVVRQSVISQVVRARVQIATSSITFQGRGESMVPTAPPPTTKQARPRTSSWTG